MDEEKARKLHEKIVDISDELLVYLRDSNVQDRLALLVLCMTTARLGSVIEDISDKDVIGMLDAYLKTCHRVIEEEEAEKVWN